MSYGLRIQCLRCLLDNEVILLYLNICRIFFPITGSSSHYAFSVLATQSVFLPNSTQNPSIQGAARSLFNATKQGLHVEKRSKHINKLLFIHVGKTIG